MKTFPIIAALAATLSAATLISSPAAAQAPVPGERVVVAYGDLDLTSQSGVARLNRRILTAVQAACGTPSDSDPHGKIAINQCRHRTFDQASSQARRAIALASRTVPTVLAGR
jgi:UrcA family protein